MRYFSVTEGRTNGPAKEQGDSRSRMNAQRGGYEQKKLGQMSVQNHLPALSNLNIH